MSATPFRPAVEALERRDTPAFTFSLNAAGDTATVVGDNAGDGLVIFAFGGALQHNRGGDPGLASALDWDSTVPDTQPLPAAAASLVVVQTLGGGDDSLTIGTPARPANGLLARFQLLDGGSGIDSLSVDNSGETAGTTYTHRAGLVTAPTLSVAFPDDLEFGDNYSLGSGDDTFNVLEAVNNINVSAGGGLNTVRRGRPTAGMANVLGDVSVGGGLDSTRLILDDAASTTADNVAVGKAPWRPLPPA
jgi:hypothetical protein